MKHIERALINLKYNGTESGLALDKVESIFEYIARTESEGVTISTDLIADFNEISEAEALTVMIEYFNDIGIC